MYLARIEDEPSEIASEGRIRLFGPSKPTEGNSFNPTVKIKIKMRAVQNDGIETQVWFKTERQRQTFFFLLSANVIPRKVPIAMVKTSESNDREAVVFKAPAIKEETLWLYL